jgi:hypothetical protein
MNVFILGTGRCGSVTFIKACQAIENYSCGHESRVSLAGEQRFLYPENHIEADNRLSWFLGELETAYGDEAFYVHLTRDREKTALSFHKRFYNARSIVLAYSEGIKMMIPETMNYDQRYQACLDYVDTVNANITAFLEGKSKVIHITLENIEDDFVRFWDMIGATGDLDNALKVFSVKHNESSSRRTMNVKQIFLYPFLLFWRRLFG